MQNFEDYLCERNDTIDNAAYQLIGVLTAEDPGASLEDDPATPNWDMAIIGEVVDAVKEIIIEKVGYTCHPFYCDEVPCYLTRTSAITSTALCGGMMSKTRRKQMKRKVDFDWYCKTKKDVINNAAYELIVALTAKSAPPRKFELSIPQWDDLMIANIVENAINAIDERIGYYCHPFYHEVDKLPCYLGDRCDNPHCIFKSDPDYRKAPSSVVDMDIEERG